jgi:hypothetical protein
MRKKGQKDVVAFPVCNGAHHYVCMLQLNNDGIVEVLVLDSLWSGSMSLQEFERTGCPIKPDQDAVFEKLDDRADRMVVLDGYLRYVVAVFAQIFWPADITKPRRVIQKFPLVPHQGGTNNCGVYAFYFLACLYVDPVSFLRALGPGKRLVVGSTFAEEHRKMLLDSARDAVNAYDVSLEEFYLRLRDMHG